MERVGIRVFAAVRGFVLRPYPVDATVRGRDGFSFAPRVVVWISFESARRTWDVLHRMPETIVWNRELEVNSERKEKAASHKEISQIQL